MRAARVTAFGPVEDIKVAEVERPVPASGQVLVRIAAAGVNFADTGMVRGTARRSEPPFSPGVEAAGVIEEANGAAADLVPGTRVVYWDPVPAAFAEYAVVDGWRCVPVPDDVPDDVAVALMVQGAPSVVTASSTRSNLRWWLARIPSMRVYISSIGSSCPPRPRRMPSMP